MHTKAVTWTLESVGSEMSANLEKALTDAPTRRIGVFANDYLVVTPPRVRVRARIGCAKMSAEPPGRQGAKRENTRLYLTEEQRSRAGWIGAQTA